MSATKATIPTTRTYRVEVSDRNALILPEALAQELGVSPGDIVELQVVGEHAELRRAPKEPTSSLRGLLSKYFKDREDVERFIEKERRGWEERDEELAPLRKLLWEHRRSSRT